MDKSLFKSNERNGEYIAEFNVTGSITVHIRALSLEEAKEKADAMLENDEFGLELNDVNDVDVSHVYKAPTMYLVTRDGRKMQVSYLKNGDMPRDPDERGF